MSEDSMILKFFLDLTKVEGIESIVLYSNDNKILDSWTLPNFNINIFNDIGINYFQIFSILDKTNRDFQEIVVAHERGQIYARPLSNLLVVVIARLKVDISLIRLILNIGMPELLGFRKLQKILKKISIENHHFLTNRYLDETEQAFLKKTSS